MEMRDRLIELIEGAENQRTAIALCCTLDELIDVPSRAEYIAEHLIENGVIVPPCKVGDKIYVVDRALRKIIKKTVSEIRLTDWNEIYVHSYGFGYPSSLFGKTVFLTKEEAKAKLKERDGNG